MARTNQHAAAASVPVPKPFGSIFVNGWDFDIEKNSGNQYYQYMTDKWRSNFISNFRNTTMTKLQHPS